MRFLLMIFFMMLLSFSHAQQGLVAGGGAADGIGGLGSYSVGQLFIDFQYNSKVWQVQGLQQTYDANMKPLGLAQPILKPFNVYPNPIKPSQLLQWESPCIPSQIRIFNILGNQVASYQYPTNGIDISFLPPGAYIFEILMEEGPKRATFIIQ